MARNLFDSLFNMSTGVVPPSVGQTPSPQYGSRADVEAIEPTNLTFDLAGGVPGKVAQIPIRMAGELGITAGMGLIPDSTVDTAMTGGVRSRATGARLVDALMRSQYDNAATLKRQNPHMTDSQVIGQTGAADTASLLERIDDAVASKRLTPTEAARYKKDLMHQEHALQNVDPTTGKLIQSPFALQLQKDNWYSSIADRRMHHRFSDADAEMIMPLESELDELFLTSKFNQTPTATDNIAPSTWNEVAANVASGDPATVYTSRLGEFLNHDRLYDEYPELRYTQFNITDIPKSLANAFYHPDNGVTISTRLLKDGTPEQMENAIRKVLHEIQHNVQKIEGDAYKSLRDNDHEKFMEVLADWDDAIPMPPMFKSMQGMDQADSAKWFANYANGIDEIDARTTEIDRLLTDVELQKTQPHKDIKPRTRAQMVMGELVDTYAAKIDDTLREQLAHPGRTGDIINISKREEDAIRRGVGFRSTTGKQVPGNLAVMLERLHKGDDVADLQKAIPPSLSDGLFK